MYILDLESRGDKRLTEMFLSNITVPKSYKDEEKIQEYIRKKEEDAAKEMACDPDLNEIICIGIKEQGKPGVLMSLEEYAAWLKASVIIGEAKVQNIHQKMITFNGKQFDIPTIIRSGIKNNIDLPYMELAMQCDKYKAKNHIDLMQELSIGYNNYKSLDMYLQIYLGISKKPVDFKTATDEEIKEHCLEDIENTAKLFNKFVDLFVWKNPKASLNLKEENDRKALEPAE